MRPSKFPFVRSLNKGQLLFALIGFGYFFFLVGSVFARSIDRASVLSSNSAFSASTNLVAGLGVEEKDSSSLQLQEFHRVEVKDGKILWEVKAKEAKYLLKDGITHVNNSSLVFYRADGTKVKVSSAAARLSSRGMSVGTAELEGEVLVEIGDQMKIESDLAVYDSGTRTILMPKQVSIVGEGFSVSGDDLQVKVDQQLIVLRKNVNSRFDPNAKIPKGAKFQ